MQPVAAATAFRSPGGGGRRLARQRPGNGVQLWRPTEALEGWPPPPPGA